MRNGHTWVLVLCLLNLGVIALLPRLFFRPGRLNPAWWLTAAPYAVAGLGVAGGLLGWVDAWSAVPAWTGVVRALAATVLSAGSLWLIGFTVGAHTHPVSLWHQRDDEPERIIRSGPYRWVRHPFYAAFLAGLGACFFALPAPLTGIALAFGLVQMTRTAMREERRLSNSRHGAQYRDYMRRTGRFVPRRSRSA